MRASTPPSFCADYHVAAGEGYLAARAESGGWWLLQMESSAREDVLVNLRFNRKAAGDVKIERPHREAVPRALVTKVAGQTAKARHCINRSLARQ